MNPNQYPQGQGQPPQYFQQQPPQQQMFNQGYPVGRYPPVAYPQGEQQPSQMPPYPGMPANASGAPTPGYPPVHIKSEPHWGVEGGQPQQPTPQSQPFQQQPQPMHYMHQTQTQQPFQQQQPMTYHHQMAMPPNDPYMQRIQQQQQPFQQMHSQQSFQQETQQSISSHEHQIRYIPSANFPHSVSSTHSNFSASKAMGAQQDNQNASVNQSSILQPPKLFSVNLEEEKLSTGELCLLGREIVSDLSYRTSHLASILKKVMERKALGPTEDPQFLADQCKTHLDKLVEIRLMIEKNRDKDWKRMSGDDYIAMVLDENERENATEIEITDDLLERTKVKDARNAPREGMVWYEGRWIPEHLEKKYKIFEENKKNLLQVSSELKSIGWVIDVSSPVYLKKPEKTQWTKREAAE